MKAQPSAATDNEPQRKFKTGPLAEVLQKEIVEALKATTWPALNPSIEAAIAAPGDLEVGRCSGATPPSPGDCIWGSQSAPLRAVLVGDSIAINYAMPLTKIALNSGGKIQLQIEAMAGCQFSDDWIFNPDRTIMEACPARKQHAVDVINATKPDVVIVSGSYSLKSKADSINEPMGADEWARGLGKIIDKFKTSTKKIVFLAAPPADKNISECYGNRSSTPADCVSEVTSEWASTAEVTQGLAKSLGGVFIDSRPFFCSDDGYCPAFVGSTPTKRDTAHMTEAYAEKIRPAIDEAFRAAAIFS